MAILVVALMRSSFELHYQKLQLSKRLVDDGNSFSKKDNFLIELYLSTYSCIAFDINLKYAFKIN